MPRSALLNFLFLLLYRHRVKHTAVFTISTLIVMLLSAVMFLATAIERDVATSLHAQPDFVVQKMRGGKAVDAPMEWAEEFAQIPGVSHALPRVYGHYFYNPNEHHFTIVGIDLFDAQVNAALQELVSGLDAKAFLSKNHMIIGSGVKRFLDEYHFYDYYVFRPPDRSKERVSIYKHFPDESSIVSNDMIIMDIDLARKILGLEEEASTDIILYVPNELEHDNIRIKLILKHFDIRVINKSEIARAYTNLFNYKGGLFLMLYMIVLLTFVLILYQRYSMISSTDKKEIGILRAVGWSIQGVIILKVSESLVVAVGAFMLGIVLAYVYVFLLDAPLLSSLFFGWFNMPTDIALSHGVDLAQLSQLFIFFVVPFVAAVLVPVWRVATVDAVEAMK